MCAHKNCENLCLAQHLEPIQFSIRNKYSENWLKQQKIIEYDKDRNSCPDQLEAETKAYRSMAMERLLERSECDDHCAMMWYTMRQGKCYGQSKWHIVQVTSDNYAWSILYSWLNSTEGVKQIFDPNATRPMAVASQDMRPTSPNFPHNKSTCLYLGSTGDKLQIYSSTKKLGLLLTKVTMIVIDYLIWEQCIARPPV